MTNPASLADSVPGRIGLEDGRRIRGFVDARYGAVMDAFVANFVERRDLGAGCAVYVDGAPLLSPRSLEDLLGVQSAGPQLSGLPDDGTRWGTGFQLASPPSQPMLGPTSFGHAGAGGQLGFGDVDHHVGFAYLSNQMGGYGDARARELTMAVRAAIGA